MTGDTGPYQNDTGDVWVPRTVPYLDARRIAKSGFYEGDRDKLTYVGKDDVDLLGFTLPCFCEEVCERRYPNDEDSGEKPCSVPAWHFRLEERW